MLVFVIDLDGTVQGDVYPQIQEYVFLKSLNMKYNSKFLSEDYSKGLLRPHFKKFVDAVQSRNRTHNMKVEMFIYTASETKWASVIVPVIEKLIGFKFNRPLFTRAHCDMSVDKHKSLKQISPSIVRTLRKKFGNVVNSEGVMRNTYLIDNNFVLQDPGHLVKCPSYERVIYIDPLRQLSNQEAQQHKKQICATILRRKYNNESIWEILEGVYRAIKENHRSNHRANKKSKKDAFWNAMAVVVQSSQTPSDIIVKLKQVIS